MCRDVAAMMSSMKILERTSQLAKVFGIDFTSVLTRGSQYRVESMLLRLTKVCCSSFLVLVLILMQINNYVLLTPSRKQVNEQRAALCQALNMEPRSNFYHDPVLVLDFQSLYPSMMIAYNLCFSTCLGEIPQAPSATPQFGCLPKSPASLSDMGLLGSDRLNIAPLSGTRGVLFARPEVRRGVLPAMLEEILETRKMVKARMKLSDKEPVLKQMLDFCQLALKLIANVTYGYTAASFSGRMPCIDLGDSIVGLGRRTTENAKSVIESTWPHCKVV